MKKITKFLALALVFVSTQSFAQNLKFGHVNLQEIVALMTETDSANVKLEKFGKDLSETMEGMQTEFQNKYQAYQQKYQTWTAAVLESKQKELQDMETRLQQFQQNAQGEYQQMQQQLFAPIFKKANEAIDKIGKDNGYIYIFDTSVGNILYINDSQSTDITSLAKKALNISPDKKLPAPNAQQAQAK